MENELWRDAAHDDGSEGYTLEKIHDEIDGFMEVAGSQGGDYREMLLKAKELKELIVNFYSE